MRPFYRTTIGQKVIMAVTGLILVGFLLAHMLGNLQVFQGPAAINDYAAFLHGPLAKAVWAQRVALLLAVLLHAWAAWSLTRRRATARPDGYAKREDQVSTFASRTIRIGGVVILAFVVYHILHFTTLDLDRSYVRGDVYGNLVKAFNEPLKVLIYVVAMIFIGLHLYHGLWSSVRTLGVSPASAHPLRRKVSLALAAIVWLGFTLVPVAIFAGLVK
jgi:succinate dehydrogenase / fumarate reductase cytochrome b subunit